ncbi:Z-ring formation inhibitor MciZ [Shouchella shacheensis]|uniref:Z-ring formation inhibitor MciZ n=1 Tax=Shouchella shacheensis TaxID=1649580 RepID=UPI0009EAE591|nr:Z-ring formation inhibitor MciZ [Shouchella shacheensis]
MRIYVHASSVVLTGKKWEVLAKLKEMAHTFDTVRDWQVAVYESPLKQKRVASVTPIKNARSKETDRPIV